MKRLLAAIASAMVICSCSGGPGKPEPPYAGQTLLNQHMADQKHHIGVVVGDSMAQMPNVLPETGDWSGLLDMDVFNGGIGGDTTVRMLDRFWVYLDMEPEFILLLPSTNDCPNGVAFNPATFDMFRTMVEMALAEGIKVYIVQQAFPTPYINSVSFGCLAAQRQAAFDLAAELDLEVIDLYPTLSPNGYLLDEFNRAAAGDIMHPNADAYFEAAHIIGPYINRQ